MSRSEFEEERWTDLADRKCFYENQPIHQEENHTYEFKHFAMFSANAQLNELTLLKTICGMLNCLGGYILIGIKERQEGGDIQREVVGYAFSQLDKQKYKMYITTLTKRFYPKVDTSILDVQVKFVPVVCSRGKRYVIKLIVAGGLQNLFYSFRYRFAHHDCDVNLFFKRYDCQTRQIVDMSEIYSEIIERSKLPSTRNKPIRTSNYRQENELYEKLKQARQEAKQPAESEEFERSELYDVMPTDSEQSVGSTGSETINPNFASSQQSQPQQRTVLQQSTTTTTAKIEVSSLSVEIHSKSFGSESTTAPKPEPCSTRPYRRTIVRLPSTASEATFQKYMKEFKRTRTKKSLVRGTPEYIIEFAGYDQHKRFTEQLDKEIGELSFQTQ